jgi:hypothetical protein
MVWQSAGLAMPCHDADVNVAIPAHCTVCNMLYEWACFIPNICSAVSSHSSGPAQLGVAQHKQQQPLHPWQAAAWCGMVSTMALCTAYVPQAVALAGKQVLYVRHSLFCEICPIVCLQGPNWPQL